MGIRNFSGRPSISWGTLSVRPPGQCSSWVSCAWRNKNRATHFWRKVKAWCGCFVSRLLVSLTKKANPKAPLQQTQIRKTKTQRLLAYCSAFLSVDKATFLCMHSIPVLCAITASIRVFAVNKGPFSRLREMCASLLLFKHCANIKTRFAQYKTSKGNANAGNIDFCQFANRKCV